MERDVEAQPETIRVETQRLTDEREVRGRAHRQELREPLHDPEQSGGGEVAHRMPARAARSAS